MTTPKIVMLCSFDNQRIAGNATTAVFPRAKGNTALVKLERNIPWNIPRKTTSAPCWEHDYMPFMIRASPGFNYGSRAGGQGRNNGLSRRDKCAAKSLG
jgi:hypothetical protein